MHEPQCMRCDRVMEPGFIPDAAHSVHIAAKWHPGLPEKTRFLGMEIGVKMDAKVLLPITAYRCPDCGTLELVACDEEDK